MLTIRWGRLLFTTTFGLCAATREGLDKLRGLPYIFYSPCIMVFVYNRAGFRALSLVPDGKSRKFLLSTFEYKR
ncbi:hypothetical protein F5Y11DRAFT_15918 [Daldinia sp. FL1419]|nr:hypothetical protein F5Y11DRAFT_15918 [Daldinia sp. FL1419]